jgi:leucyl-tRNA synthetase
MADYNFREIEKKWRQRWADEQLYKVDNDTSLPKCYVLDMFPYPSGAGLHVGHPLGYIATDIYSRYKRQKGFNVLHPMGYDAFGLPAEQYAIQTGQHPAITTENNIGRYREQLDNLGFSFDWSREVRTSDPSYYKWTQWIFIQLFHSWYNKNSNKAEPIDTLVAAFQKNGNADVNASSDSTETFSADEWKAMSEKKQQEILLGYRLAFLSDTLVNWCPQLGTVLANEEVKDGVSERGGYPVVKKLMKQWSMRITAYAERLLNDLDEIEWTDSIKEAQRNWIGKSEGCSIRFEVENDGSIEVFTTRPDTIFGVSFLTLAPEHELVEKITTADRKAAVEAYITSAKNRSERDRMADVKTISGEFTGAYAIHPFSGQKIPVWVGDYVLAGYGTGAVMAVPGHDTRDYAFAKHFNLPIPEVVAGGDLSVEAYDAKEGTLVNSDFLNGLPVKLAIKKAIQAIEEKGLGKGQTNFRLRDAIFGRQRYWGEPIPIYYKDGIPYTVPESQLPLVLPEIDQYKPTETGEPPLARAKDWKYEGKYDYEHSTMPGWAGSSWYFLRYMDPKNDQEFASKEAMDYWKNVDLYMGGAEHSTGHLLYVRFWTKFLFDRGWIPKKEPAEKLINQGMIQGVSLFINTAEIVNETLDTKTSYFFSDQGQDIITLGNEAFKLIDKRKGFRVPIKYADSKQRLYKSRFQDWKNDPQREIFYFAFGAEDQILWDKDEVGEDYIQLLPEIEKMSKSKYNVENPDDIIDQYGADALRMYEMFLGPIEQAKPWNTHSIDGVSRFLRKLWRLFHDEQGNFSVSDEAPTAEELKILHRTIKKVEEDIERFSFNTSVSSFMIAVNELGQLKTDKKAILSELLILISSYAPHIAEELWSMLGNIESITKAKFPKYNPDYLVENSFEYPVAINGKMRAKVDMPLDLPDEDMERTVLQTSEIMKWLEGKTPKKVIIVRGRMVNLVV